MEKGSAGAHGPGTTARTSPPRREDLAQDVLMYPNLRSQGTRKSLLQPQLPVAPPRTFPSHSAPSPLPATGSWRGRAELHPLPQLCPKVSKGLFIFCCWLHWEMKWSLCVKGRIKDNIWVVHSVLTGEIPAHGDTSLLTPPICIFSPLGNSGGQIKQVCSGLGEKKNPKPPFLCI